MGGVEAHCEELLPRIASIAPQLDIEVIARRPYLPNPASVGRVRVTPLYSPRGRSTEAIVSTLVGVLHARHRGAHAVHIHAIGPALLAPLARMLGMRVIFTHHGADYDRQKWGRVAKTMLRLGEALGVRYANAVIAVAPSLAANLQSRFSHRSDKIHYVPNGKTGFPGNSDGESVLASLGLTPRDYVLAVGRLVPEKGLHTLIAAMRRSGCTRKLVIVGGADHESRYSKALLEEADDNIIFAGVQNRSALHALYTHAALFVLPSMHEGLPIVALEAGSLGCPILLSDIQPNRDLGLPPGNYFPVADEEALAQCLAAPPQTFRVPKGAFDRFDWDRVADETLSIYRSVLARKSLTSPVVSRRLAGGSN